MSEPGAILKDRSPPQFCRHDTGSSVGNPLITLPRRQQPGQVPAEPPPLRHMSEQVIETGPRTPPADPAQADTPPAWSSLITGFQTHRKPLPPFYPASALIQRTTVRRCWIQEVQPRRQSCRSAARYMRSRCGYRLIWGPAHLTAPLRTRCTAASDDPPVATPSATNSS